MTTMNAQARFLIGAFVSATVVMITAFRMAVAIVLLSAFILSTMAAL